jgi:hypothetical protein
MPRSPNYYDIDAILADEELIPCTTLFEFSYLAHLDPDIADMQQHLPEKSRIHVPLWAIDKWAMVNYVSLSLPRQYGRKARERLEADPSEVDLCKRNGYFFRSGVNVINLIEQSCRKLDQGLAAQGRNSGKLNELRSQLFKLQQEASALRQTLLLTYTGDRLRHTLDWALSSVGDDVSRYTSRLTEMEKNLFRLGTRAATNHVRWKMLGSRRVLPPTTRPMAPIIRRAVTPDPPQMDATQKAPNKRQRTL